MSGPGWRLAGVGVDVVGVSRLARVRAAGRADLLARLCAPEEEPDRADETRAARLWAGKEAVAKTLGTGFWQAGVDWPDIRLLPDGRIALHGRAAAIAGEARFALDFTQLGDRMLAVALRWVPA